MAEKKIIVLANKLTRGSILYLSTLAFLGYDVRYMFYPEYLKTPGTSVDDIETKLKKKGLTKIDLVKVEGLNAYGHHTYSPEYAKIIYEQIFGAVDIELMSELFTELKDCTAKVRILLFDVLIFRIMKTGEMLSVARALKEQGHHVRIFYPADAVQRHLFTKDVSGFENIAPSFLSMISTFGLVGRYAYRLATRFCGRFKNIFHATIPACSSQELKRSVMPQVAYFPHKGVFYGDLFLKDEFYEKDPLSPFFPERILHIELHDVPLEETLKYYSKNKIEFKVLNLGLEPNRKTILAIWRAWKCVWRATRGNDILPRVSTSLLVMRGYISFLNAWQNTAFLDGVKLVLVGYGYLFPVPLALALQSRGIKVVAMQERFMQIYHNRFHPVFDTFFISGPVVRERLKQNPFLWIDKTPEVGMVRAELLKSYLGDRKFPRQKTVLVLDYLTIPDQLFDIPNPLLSWKSNKDFYKDIIRLARVHKDVRFIIRGKDDVWCDIPYFSEVFSEIETAPNIEINRQYDELNVSYKLAATADLIIARHTSLGDEAMANGIPVLFHDWREGRKHNISGVCNYSGYDVFTHDFDTLNARVQTFFAEGIYLPPGEFNTMRKELFGALDLKVKDKILKHLKTMID